MARISALRSFFRRSQQDRVQDSELEGSSAATSSPTAPTIPQAPTEGFGDITDGTSNTLVVGEQAAVVEPSTEAFDEGNALFGRRTEIGDTEPAASPSDSSGPGEHVPPASPPTPPGVPIPYPNTARTSELDASAFGRGARNEAVESADVAAREFVTGSTDPDPDLATSPAADPELNDPFETAHTDDASTFEEEAGIDDGLDRSPGDVDTDIE